MEIDDIYILQSVNNKAAIKDVYNKTNINIRLNLKSYKIHTWLNYDVHVLLSILQAGIDRRVLINAVDRNGKYKLNAITYDISKIQGVDGSTLYDDLELTFNTVDKTSMLELNHTDILQSINRKAAINDVSNKHEVDLRFSRLLGAAPAVLDISVGLAAAVGNDQTYATAIQTHSINKADQINN